MGNLWLRNWQDLSCAPYLTSDRSEHCLAQMDSLRGHGLGADIQLCGLYPHVRSVQPAARALDAAAHRLGRGQVLGFEGASGLCYLSCR